MSPLSKSISEDQFNELDALLMRRRTGITDIIELEGFLTALIIGPTTPQPSHWLPKVWGGKSPKFKDLPETNKFISLVMGYYNDIAAWFEYRPEQFQPTFYESKSEGKRVIIVDEWCYGFLKGMRLEAAAWRPLKKERPDLLMPLQLFGSPAGWKSIRAGDEVAIHQQWSPKVTPAVREIYRYWSPHRVEVREGRAKLKSH